MWDYDSPPYAQIYVCMYLILIPYIDDVLVLFMEMYGRRMRGIHVPYGMDYFHLMRTLEEQFMEGWIGENLAYEGRLSHVGVTNEGGLQHSPCQLLEDKKHLGREDCNI